MSLVNYYSSSDSEVEMKDPLQSVMRPVRRIDKEDETDVEDVKVKKQRLFGGTVEKVDIDDAIFEVDRNTMGRYNKDKSEDESVKESENTEREGESESESGVDKNDSISEGESTKEQTTQLKLPLSPSSETPFQENPEWHVPKKQIHRYAGHVGGVAKVRFFPNSGHLLLSGGMDGSICFHDVYKDKATLASISSHRLAVKDVKFGFNGSKFVTCSFDKFVKLFDTQTGKEVHNIKTKAIPNCLSFNVENNNELVVGLSNSIIEHYDLRVDPSSSDHLIQSYNHHMDSVTSVNYLKNNKFMSTSDDRSIRVWNSGINIPIKTILDPGQYSMPRSTVSPDMKYFVTQSMDNKVMVYQAMEKFKQNKKKIFTGHEVSGYGVELAFSPDGKVLMSGGIGGVVYFWNWKTTKMISSIKVDSGVIWTVDANPGGNSEVAMAGAGGAVYLWK